MGSSLFSAKIVQDSAFLDRADIKQYVSNPSPRASYEILRSSMNELIRCSVLKNVSAEENSNISTSVPTNNGDVAMNPLDQILIPSFAEMNVHLWDQPESPARKLWQIVQSGEVWPPSR